MKRIHDLPNMLLITQHSYDQQYGTGVQLKPLIERYGNRIAWYSLNRPSATSPHPEFKLIEYAHGSVLQRPSRLKRLRYFLNYTLWGIRLGKEAAKLGKRHHVAVVWAYLNPIVMPVAWAAAKILGVPLAIVIHDDPIELLMQNQSDAWVLPVARRWFRVLQKNAKSRAVIGESMAEYYLQKYNVQSTILIVGPNNCAEPRLLERDKEVFYIASIGRLWPRDRALWHQLLGALQILNARKLNLTIKLLRIGELDASFEIDKRVEVTGFLAEAEFSEQLNRIDIGFVGLPFVENSVFSFTSFPSRIMSFIRAQRPFIALGPQGSTAVTFVERHGCGLACTSMEPSSLADSILRLLFEPGVYEYAQWSLDKIQKDFSPDVYFQNFEEFISKALK